MTRMQSEEVMNEALSQVNWPTLSSDSRPDWGSLIKRATFRGLSRVIGPATRTDIETSRIDRILVLQMQQLGDTVIFTPALRAIRRRYPNARIDLLVNQISYQFYKKCPYVDHLYVDVGPQGKSWRLRQLLPLLRQVRRIRYDLVLADVTQVAARYATVAFLTGARMRVGFEADDRGFLYTTRLPRPEGADFIECNLRLAAALGASTDSRQVECFFDTQDYEYAGELLGAGNRNGPTIVVHPASNWQSKTWFADRWASVCDALVEEHNARLVFVGTEREASEITSIMERMKSPALSVAGRTSLSQLAAVIARADLFVGTDSGPRHVAAGTGRPQVTLMSSLDIKTRWHFNRPNEIVLRTDPSCSGCQLSYCSHRRCMDAISTSLVLNACSELLSRNCRERETDAVTEDSRSIC